MWKGNFQHLIAKGMTLHCCHNVLIGNDSFYDTHNEEGLESLGTFY